MKTLLTALVLFVSFQAPAANASPVSFRDVLNNGKSALPIEGLMIISDDKAFQMVWNAIHSNRIPAPAAPAIDFNQETLLLFQDSGKSTGMIDVAFESVIDLGAKLSATIVQTEPGMGCFVTADIGHPMHMIAIPNKTAKYGWANKQVDVTVKKVVIDCE